MNIRNKHLVDEEIVVDEPELFNCIAESVLERCVIECRVPAEAFCFDDVEIRNCVFKAAAKFSGFRWDNLCTVSDTVFLGNLEDNIFGEVKKGREGQMKSCNFRDADILGATFFENCEIETVTFPQWPFFVIEYPFENRRRMLRKCRGDEDLTDFVESLRYLNRRVRGWGCDVELAIGKDTKKISELRDFLESCENVIIG